jgi:hypothetical protein
MRREPSMYQKCHFRTARVGCQLCQDGYEEQKIEKDKAMVICQGCPQMVQRHFGVIRWEKMDGPLAGWLMSNFEVRIDKGAADGASKWVSVQGWKGFSNINEERELNGTSLPSVTDLESKIFQS